MSDHQLSIQFPFLKERNASKILGIGILFTASSFLILFVFQPFGEVRHNFAFWGIVRLLSYSMVAGGSFIFLDLIILPSVRKHIDMPDMRFWLCWYAVVLWFISFAIFLCKNYWMDFTVFSLRDYGVVVWRVSTIALVPALLLLGFSYNRQTQTADSSEVLFQSTDINPEFLKLPTASVHCISSEDNYVAIRYLVNGEFHRKLLRNSLANLENQLPPSFIRVHRSHIVNLSSIEAVGGNSQGRYLSIRGMDEAMKVSRKYLPTFMQAWQHYSRSL